MTSPSIVHFPSEILATTFAAQRAQAILGAVGRSGIRPHHLEGRPCVVAALPAGIDRFGGVSTSTLIESLRHTGDHHRDDLYTAMVPRFTDAHEDDLYHLITVMRDAGMQSLEDRWVERIESPFLLGLLGYPERAEAACAEVTAGSAIYATLQAGYRLHVNQAVGPRDLYFGRFYGAILSASGAKLRGCDPKWACHLLRDGLYEEREYGDLTQSLYRDPRWVAEYIMAGDVDESEAREHIQAVLRLSSDLPLMSEFRAWAAEMDCEVFAK
jgi:hypothetical protein